MQNQERFEGRASGFFAALNIPCSGGLLDPGKRARTLEAAVVKSKIRRGLCLRTYYSSGRKEGHAS